jgi:hypothetical protein
MLFNNVLYNLNIITVNSYLRHKFCLYLIANLHLDFTDSVNTQLHILLFRDPFQKYFNHYVLSTTYYWYSVKCLSENYNS